MKCDQGRRALAACLMGLCATGVPAMQIDGAWPLHGEPPRDGLGGALDLVTHDGERFHMGRLQGAPTLVFFGFTRCSQTCPVAMAQAQQVLASFKADRPPNIVFVTLDPLSDPPPALKAYLSQFDRRIIGLTGTPTQVEAVAARYGVGMTGQGSGLEHSSRWYLLDGLGRLVQVYRMDVGVGVLAQDLRRMRTPQPWATAWKKGAP